MSPFPVTEKIAVDFAMRTVGLRSICTTSRNDGESRSTTEDCGDGVKEGEGSGISGPYWTMTEIANSSQVLERYGGDDETRTRDLCRDSLGMTAYQRLTFSTGAAKSLKRTVRTVAVGRFVGRNFSRCDPLLRVNEHSRFINSWCRLGVRGEESQLFRWNKCHCWRGEELSKEIC